MSNEVMYIVSSVINNIAPAMIASATQNQPKEEIFNKGTLNSANEPSANKPVAKETALEQNSKYKDKTSEEVLSSIVEGFSELSNDIKKDLIHKYETILEEKTIFSLLVVSKMTVKYQMKFLIKIYKI